MKAFTPETHLLAAVKHPERKEILDANQACSFLAIHRNTLYKLITEGEIPAFRLSTGGRWKFRRTDLEDWLADRQARSVR
jgi:excisionase family DNA binding protein